MVVAAEEIKEVDAGLKLLVTPFDAPVVDRVTAYVVILVALLDWRTFSTAIHFFPFGLVDLRFLLRLIEERTLVIWFSWSVLSVVSEVLDLMSAFFSIS